MFDRQSLSAPRLLVASVVVAAAACSFVASPSYAAASLAKRGELANLRATVIGAKALVDKGDLTRARARVKDLDVSWDGAAAGKARQHWRVVDRAIDHALDRALVALRPRSPHVAMGGKALADLIAIVDQVSGQDQKSAKGGRA